MTTPNSQNHHSIYVGTIGGTSKDVQIVMTTENPQEADEALSLVEAQVEGTEIFAELLVYPKVTVDGVEKATEAAIQRLENTTEEKSCSCDSDDNDVIPDED